MSTNYRKRRPFFVLLNVALLNENVYQIANAYPKSSKYSLSVSPSWHVPVFVVGPHVVIFEFDHLNISLITIA